MTPSEAAAKLTLCQYRNEMSDHLAKELKANGLVAVYGGSDDLCYIAGADADEIGAYNGTDVLFTKKGLLRSKCEDSECPYFEVLASKAAVVTAIWSRDGYSWVYETKIPHETFIVMEDSDTYCRGIVFALSDVPEAA